MTQQAASSRTAMPISLTPAVVNPFMNTFSGAEMPRRNAMKDGQVPTSGAWRLAAGWLISALVFMLATGTTAKQLSPPSGSHEFTQSVNRGVTQGELFASSFEAVATVIDLNSARPRPGAMLSSAFSYDIGVNYTLGEVIGPGVVTLALDGIDISAGSYIDQLGVSHYSVERLPVGNHSVEVHVGGEQASWSFAIVAAPTISDFVPTNQSLPAGSRPTLSASFQDSGSAIQPDSIRLLFNDEDEVADQAEIVFSSPNAGTIRYTPLQSLAAGTYFATLYVGNQLGAVAASGIVFTVEADAEYAIAFVAPAAGITVLDPQLAVRVTAASNRSEVESVHVNGQFAVVQSYAATPRPFITTLRLAPGPNTLTATARFADGEERSVTTTVTYDAPPVVTLTSPPDWATLGPLVAGTLESNRPTTITGTVSRPVVAVTINQRAATLSSDGLGFTFEQFPLHAGSNLLSANAVDELGRVGTAQTTIYVDQVAPQLQIDGPSDQSLTSASQIDVHGIANDAIEGGLNAPEPVVEIRNTANAQTVVADVSDRHFLARDVPLEVGNNALTVTATDALGNARSQSMEITRIAAGSRRITLLSGNRQVGAIEQELAAPLRVVAMDAAGLPLVGLPIRFDVLRGSGSIRLHAGEVARPDGVSAARNLMVNTDANGQAEVWAQLGGEAGEAGNVVRAWTETLAEEVIFTATGLRGAPAWVLVSGMSGSQFVATSSQPMEALSVVVLDSAFNAMRGLRVRFQIEDGDARFDVNSAVNGEVSGDGRVLIVSTDKNGIASVRPLTGALPGTVRVRAEALVDGALFGGADFQLMVLERQDGPTGFSGIVMDHSGATLAGVRLSIGQTSLSTFSDAEGKFAFQDQVPPGKIDLFVDGTAVRILRDGQTLQYPALHFEAAVIQGQMNQLPHALYLPPINMAEAKIVGGDEDVSLAIPGMDGFEMIVKAHSVTFPDGTHSGPMVVSRVNGDRLPMAPPGGFGTFGAVAWTLQPSGTRFDPPVEVRLPNAAGLARGASLPIVQWDHDLRVFLPMGRGTVSEDGARIQTDPGTGITKAGWGGGPPPAPPNCGVNPPPPLVCRGASCSLCADCQSQQSNTGQACPSCRTDPAQLGNSCGGNFCRRCNGNGACVADPVNYPEDAGEAVTEIDFPEPRVVTSPIQDQALFAGYRPSLIPANWDFQVEPYCTAEGVWRFQLSKAKIETSIIRSQPPNHYELADAEILVHLEDNSPAYCRYYNSVEFTMLWNNSTHYPGGPRGNPDINNLLALGWGGADSGQPYNRWTAIEAHEELHFRRFKEYVRTGWDAFLTSIQAMQLSMTQYPTLDSARASPETQELIESAVRTLESSALEARQMRGGSGDHDPASNFYACALTQLSSVWSLLDFHRFMKSCELPARQSLSCPQ